jgi:hypothetical protein
MWKTSMRDSSEIPIADELLAPYLDGSATVVEPAEQLRGAGASRP